MVNYKEKLNEVIEGAMEVEEREKLSTYLDFLIQRGFLIKEGNNYIPTDAFRRSFFRHFVEVLVEILQPSKESLVRQKLLAEDFPARKFLVYVSLRVALELVMEEMPSIEENDLKYVNWKEVGGLMRVILSIFTAYFKEKDMEALNEKLKEALKEEKK